MKKIKVLHLDYDDLNNPMAGGGQAKATREMYKRMTDKYEFTVVTGNYPNAKEGVFEGLEYKRVGISFLGASVSILSFWLFAPFYALLHQSKYDLITEFFTAPIGPTLLPILVNKPVISWGSFLDPEKMAEKYKIPFDKVCNLLIKNYKYLVALTFNSKELLRKRNSHARIEVIPRGIDAETLNIKSIDGDYLLCLGRIDFFNNGLGEIIKAWNKISNKHLEYKLIIAGNGKNADELELQKLINTSEGKIEFIGRVEGSNKFKLLGNCALVINGAKFGNFGNVSLEALSAAKPLICFNIDGYDWIPDDLCVKVDKYSVSKLANAMDTLLKHKTHRISYGRKARVFAKSYCWENVVYMADKYYSEVIDNNKDEN